VQHHEEYQLDPPSVDPLLHGSTTMIEEMLIMDDNETPMSRKDLLTQYEHLLAEYYALVADNDIQQNSMNDDQMLLMDESNGYYYEKNDSYEADIHVSIGTLYMEEFDKVISTSSITHAMTHFEQAVRLYEMSGDVDSNTNMALAKYNLFLLHLRGGNYRMAARRYNDAIDLFRNIESHSTDVTGMDESFKDPTLFTGSVNLHQHRSKRVQEPYQSSKQQHKTLTKSEASTTRTTSPTARAIDEETKHNVESATLPVVKEKPSLYVDLQNFLSQNQSAKEEL
jgi:tetratricopeptide (TPR) repeat protein